MAADFYADTEVSSRTLRSSYEKNGEERQSQASIIRAHTSRETFAHSTVDPAQVSLARHQKFQGEVRLHQMRDEIIQQWRKTKPEEKPYKSIADSHIFSTFVMAMTVLNTLQMGFEVDYPDWTQLWIFCEHFFTAVFAFEMIIRLCAEHFGYFFDKANLLDGTLAVLGILDVWVIGIILGGRAGKMQSLSMLRILRIMRIARILRFVRRVKPLVLVLKGVAQAIMSSVYVLAVVVFSLYVFAVLLTTDLGKQKGDMYPGYSTDDEVIDTQEIVESYNPHIYWGSMSSSMITLFNMATFTEWPELIRPIALKEPWYLPIFLLYATCVGFGLMNVLVGVIVDVVFAESKRLELESNEKIKNEKLTALDKIQEELDRIDENGNGVLDLEELSRGVKESDTLMKLLAQINLPLGWATTDLLDMLDDSGDGMLAHTEFTTSFFRLLDSDHFQQMCMMRASINKVKQMLCDQKNHFGRALEIIQIDLDSIKAALGIVDACQSEGSEAVGASKPLLRRAQTPLELQGRSSARLLRKLNPKAHRETAKANTERSYENSLPRTANASPVDDKSSDGTDLISRMHLLVKECLREEFAPMKHVLHTSYGRSMAEFTDLRSSSHATRHSVRLEGAPMNGAADVEGAIRNRPEHLERSAESAGVPATRVLRTKNIQVNAPMNRSADGEHSFGVLEQWQNGESATLAVDESESDECEVVGQGPERSRSSLPKGRGSEVISQRSDGQSSCFPKGRGSL